MIQGLFTKSSFSRITNILKTCRIESTEMVGLQVSPQYFTCALLSQRFLLNQMLHVCVLISKYINLSYFVKDVF